MNYRKFKEERQKRVNEFVNKNMFYAFNQEQFNKGLKKLNATPKEIIAIASGGYLLKAKIEEFNALNKELDLELAEYIADNENLFNALIYEMWDIEYFINENDKDLFSYLGLDYQNLTEEQIAIFKKARKEYFKDIEETFF